MEIQKGRVYRHFKGDYYIVLDFATNNENDQKYVIYKALYGEGQLYIRSYDDFASLVNSEKYPHITQQYKFELQEIKSINGDHLWLILY